MEAEVAKVLRVKLPSLRHLPDGELLKACEGTLTLELAHTSVAWSNFTLEILKTIGLRK